jgi:GNAT superfamily N-acetyltransferase
MIKPATSSLQCGYASDGGYLCPLKYTDAELVILPLADCDEEQQRQAVALLRDTFATSMKISTESECKEHVLANYCCSPTDIMYVLRMEDRVVGAVSVDRKNFFPCIGHLVVHPGMRRKGYGEKLLRFAEACVKHQKFPDAFLWHARDDVRLLEYYTKRGYSTMDQDAALFVHPQDTIVLRKNVMPKAMAWS